TEVAFIQAKNAKESLERSIATMKEQMNLTKIYAPTSGSVDMVMLRAGQAIAPGMPLCNIVNMSDLKIHGEVTEAYAAKVRQGDPVQVYFPDLDKEVASRIKFVFYVCGMTYSRHTHNLVHTIIIQYDCVTML
ncbi:MAG: efflux RND transporter periplasmic adaptor subunit, partial [Bacteroidota bacterium]